MQAQWQFSNHWVSGKSLHYKNIQKHCFLFVQIEFSQKKHFRIFLYACSLATSFNEVVDVKLRINHRVDTQQCAWTAERQKKKFDKVIHVAKVDDEEAKLEEIDWRLTIFHLTGSREKGENKIEILRNMWS